MSNKKINYVKIMLKFILSGKSASSKINKSARHGKTLNVKILLKFTSD